MEFSVLSRFALESAEFKARPHIIISIRNPDSPPVDVPSRTGCRGVLRLGFHDIEPPKMSPGEKLMMPEHARRICQFVAEHLHQVDLIVCQCEAGQSRSPAVAAALACALGQDYRKFFALYGPNRHVYRLVLRAASGVLTPMRE